MVPRFMRHTLWSKSQQDSEYEESCRMPCFAKPRSLQLRRLARQHHHCHPNDQDAKYETGNDSVRGQRRSV